MPSSIVFDRAADYYDETRGFPPGIERGAAEILRRAGNLSAHSHVLEIGVGTGRIALPLMAHVSRIVGVDLSRLMMERLRNKNPDAHIHLVQGNATRLPVITAAFDAVVAVHVFHLIPEWQVALSEVARTLKPGGVLISGWGRHGFNKLFETWRSGAKTPNVGVKASEYDTFLQDAGWQPAGETLTYEFTVKRTPREHIERLKQRVWSSTWRMTDEEIEEGVAAITQRAEALYGSIDRAVTVTGSFNARAFCPPEA